MPLKQQFRSKNLQRNPDSKEVYNKIQTKSAYCCSIGSQSEESTKKTFIILAVIRRSVQRVCGPISAALRLGNSEETSQRWRAIGNTVSDLIGQGIEP